MNARVVEKEDAVPRLQLFNCAYTDCGATFVRQWRLLEHETVHTGACEEPKCAKTFRKRRALKLHLATHGTSSFRCLKSGCGMRFESHVARKAHDRRHSGEDSSVTTFLLNPSMIVYLKTHPHKRSSKSWQKRLEGRNRRPLVEDLRSLFSLRMKISPRAKLEADLTGLFNERKIPHHVDPEVNLRDLFSIRPTKVADK
uniref:P43 5S RNA-binding protein-like n=1 Tax=Sinocyclocheilus rhinocerous TaxID=307959 RepID=A0A673N7P8_9TELE